MLGVYLKKAHFTMVRDSASRVLHHWYILGDDIEYLLRNTINDRLRVGGHTVPQNCRVSPLEENAKPSPEVGDGFPLRLPSVSYDTIIHQESSDTLPTLGKKI